MTWAKFGCEFDDEVAHAGLGDAAYRTHSEAIGYVYQIEDMRLRIPKQVVRRFAGSADLEVGIKELVEARFWRDRADPGGEVSGIGIGEQIRRYLEGQGVDVDHALADAGHGRDRQRQRAENMAREAGQVYLELRAARRKLRFEQSGFARGLPGFGITKINEAQQRVGHLDAEFRDLLGNDEDLMAEVARNPVR